MKLKNFFLLFLTFVILVACSPAAETDLAVTAVQMKSTATASPSLTSSIVKTPQNVTLSPIQTPASTLVILDKNAVIGKIFLMQDGNKQPYVGAILYLAETIIDTNGNESFVAMDRINSPRTVADANGRFVFSDVPEGNYGLVLDTVRDSYFLHYPDTSEPILISVQRDSPVDLGELVFDNLPVSVE